MHQDTAGEESESIVSGEKDVPVGHTNMHVYPADCGHMPMMSSELSVEVAVMDQEINRIRRGEQAIALDDLSGEGRLAYCTCDKRYAEQKSCWAS